MILIHSLHYQDVDLSDASFELLRETAALVEYGMSQEPGVRKVDGGLLCRSKVPKYLLTVPWTYS